MMRSLFLSGTGDGERGEGDNESSGVDALGLFSALNYFASMSLGEEDV